MKIAKLVLCMVCLAPGWLMAEQAKVTEVLSLEGSIVMQVKGGNEVTLTPGRSFYEGPDDIHTVGQNASQTKAAKFLVFLVKDKGAPVLIPLSQRALR
ncbi:MAG TPA: hypothetical protein VN828_25090 [Acidobacteriaceae bacterium]|nr:hypothetical protein [Acidobacteriaceae bacterium]